MSADAEAADVDGFATGAGNVGPDRGRAQAADRGAARSGQAVSTARTVLHVRARLGTDRAHDLVAEIVPSVTVGAFADAVAARVGAPLAPDRHARAHRHDAARRPAPARGGCAQRRHAHARPRRAPKQPHDVQARFDLVVVGGPVAGKIVSLPAGTFMIGRDESCDVTLDGPVDVAQAPAREGGPGHGHGGRPGFEQRHVRPATSPLRHHEAHTLTNGERLRLARSLISHPPEPPAPRRARRRRRRQRRLQPPAARPAPLAPAEVPASRPTRQADQGPAPARRQPRAAADGRGHVPRDQEPADAAVHGADAGAGDLDLGRGPPRRQEGQRGGSSRTGRRSCASSTSSSRAADVEEEHERNAAAPDAGELIHRAVSHTADLWERRPTDPDFLHLRVGTADQPARYEVTVESGGEDNLRQRGQQLEGHHRTVPAAPVLVAVPEAGAVGLGGSPQGVTALSRWLLAQAVTLHSPRELMIAAAVREELVPELGWLKWPPHTPPARSPLEGEPLAVGPARRAGWSRR